MSVAEKIARWGLDATFTDTTLPRSPQSDFEDSEDNEDDQPFVPPRYEDLRAFLLESEEFEDLSHDLSIALQGGKVDAWLSVRSSIAKELASLPKSYNGSPGNLNFSLDLPWKPRDFLREQYGHLPRLPDLGSVITLTGATGHTYAATSETYIRKTWPRYGPLVLQVLQDALDCQQDSYRKMMPHASMELCFRDQSTQVCATGHPVFVTNAAEVLTWLATACRASIEPNSIQELRSVLHMEPKGGFDLSFSAELLTVQDLESDKSLQTNCWRGMFKNPVVALGYPTPHREMQEIGLEISLDLMLTLARTFWAAIYDGFLLLKGFNTLLTPTLKIDDSVIWHLTVDRTGDRLSYNDGTGSSCLRSVDDAIFTGARHFVGWTPCADYLVGKSASRADLHDRWTARLLLQCCHKVLIQGENYTMGPRRVVI